MTGRIDVSDVVAIRLSQPRRRGQPMVDPIDLHIGGRLRDRRVMLGVTQPRLAEALGITFQQVQKYEHGTNRLSVSMLYHAARFLSTPIPYFFEELGQSSTTDIKSSHRALLETSKTLYSLPPDMLRIVNDVARTLLASLHSND